MLPSDRRSIGSCILRPGEKTRVPVGGARSDSSSFGSPMLTVEALPRQPGHPHGSRDQSSADCSPQPTSPRPMPSPGSP